MVMLRILLINDRRRQRAQTTNPGTGICRCWPFQGIMGLRVVSQTVARVGAAGRGGCRLPERRRQGEQGGRQQMWQLWFVRSEKYVGTGVPVENDENLSIT